MRERGFDLFIFAVLSRKKQNHEVKKIEKFENFSIPSLFLRGIHKLESQDGFCAIKAAEKWSKR